MSARAWPPSPDLTGRALFAFVAPRLERAHRQRRVEVVAERQARHGAREQELRLERLVAHRDLQLVRAFGTGNRRYIKHRTRKLDWARAELARAKKRSRELGA